jgi:hypothetical protein
MYKIIGQDGKEYGPITAEQLRQWIAENRVERQTPVFTDGAKDWTFIGLLPEFATHFAGGTPPTITPLWPGASTAGQMSKTNSFATAGLILGILSVTFVCCCGGFPFNVLGLIFSIIALVQISERPGSHAGRSLAIAGLILSTASLLFLLIALASGHSHIAINTSQFQ